jgi:hypothetical protein
VIISGTVGLDEKVAPNKATSNLNWETGKRRVGHNRPVKISRSVTG